ncbi:cupredoxin domain-containing protein [Methanolobus chelungpuianus]|uniref:cupredoxin domain-containing protein n=1 Tax=Methanolobus chelungpuianus TaxID=502115 RepID=UPI002113AC50|nr:cupredoxin domain-containing protein [Methanolobus chelungpuianus]
MRKGIVISLAVLLVVFFAIGCTDTGTEDETNDTVVVPPTDNETTDQQEEPVTDDQAQEDQDVVDTTEVTVNEDGFSPETIRVMTGDTVTWTNTGQENATVTSDDDFFDSGILGPGETFSYTFDVAGTFDYGSEEDFLTSGTVIVEPGEEENAGTMNDNQTVTTVPAGNGTNVTAEDRGFNTTGEGDIVVESDQPTTTTITPDEEENDTL